MASNYVTPKLNKGEVHLYGYYDGTPMLMFTTKEKYPDLAAKIKEQGRSQIKEMLSSEWDTKEKVANALIEQMNRWHQAILNISNAVTYEVLEKAWGKDYNDRIILWMVNISSLLYLKHIKNDDMNGWLVEDHNSCQWSTVEGKHAYVRGDNTEKMLKKALKVIKNI